MRRSDLALYLVTDRDLALGRELEWVVEKAVRGGVSLVQLREKDCDTRKFVELARALKALLAGSGVPLLINDRVDVAMAADADGVHIGQSDMLYSDARRLLGPSKIIGLSVENMREVDEANAIEDLDYVAVSPVYLTPTKTDTAAAFGLDGLREAVRRSVHPACAIGGMNAGTIADVMRCGTDGVAVVSAIMSAPDPAEAAAGLRRIVDDNRLGILAL